MLSPGIQLNVKARQGKNHAPIAHSVIATWAGFLFLSGCAYCGAPGQWLAKYDPPTMKSDVLCEIYGRNTPMIITLKPTYFCRRAEIRAELERRKILCEKEWQAIDKHNIYIGMTKLAVLASWGRPYDINRTISKFGRHEQWCYGDYEHIYNYLYFENDILTSWQD